MKKGWNRSYGGEEKRVGVEEGVNWKRATQTSGTK